MSHNARSVCLFSSLKFRLPLPFSQPLVQFTFNTFMVVSFFHHRRETVTHVTYTPYKEEITSMLSGYKDIMYLDTLVISP